MLLKELNIHIQEKPPPHEFETFLHNIYKNYLKMDQRLNIRATLLQLLEGHWGKFSHDPGLGKYFLNVMPKAQATSKKMDDLNSIRRCATRTRSLKWKDNPEDSRIFAHRLSD